MTSDESQSGTKRACRSLVASASHLALFWRASVAGSRTGSIRSRYQIFSRFLDIRSFA